MFNIEGDMCFRLFDNYSNMQYHEEPLAPRDKMYVVRIVTDEKGTWEVCDFPGRPHWAPLDAYPLVSQTEEAETE